MCALTCKLSSMLLRNMRKNTTSASSWQERVESKMVGWEYRSDCRGRQAVSSAILRVLGWGSARLSARACRVVVVGGVFTRGTKQKERQRTYGFSFGKRMSTRRSKDTHLSHTTRYPTPLYTWEMQHCDASFALARLRSTMEMKDKGKLSWERVERFFQNLVNEKWELGDTIAHIHSN